MFCQEVGLWRGWPPRRPPLPAPTRSASLRSCRGDRRDPNVDVLNLTGDTVREMGMHLPFLERRRVSCVPREGSPLPYLLRRTSRISSEVVGGDDGNVLPLELLLRVARRVFPRRVQADNGAV